MLSTRHISTTLSFCDREYNKYLTSRESERLIMYSKLGVLELSGWIEEAFDEIARNFVRKQLKPNETCDILEENIDTTYGFTYKTNYRKLLVVAVGAARLLEIEKRLDQNGSLLRLRSELGILNKQRNSAAHTFIKGTTSSFDAPSVTINRFLRIEPILQRLWNMA